MDESHFAGPRDPRGWGVSGGSPWEALRPWNPPRGSQEAAALPVNKLSFSDHVGFNQALPPNSVILGRPVTYHCLCFATFKNGAGHGAPHGGTWVEPGPSHPPSERGAHCCPRNLISLPTILVLGRQAPANPQFSPDSPFAPHSKRSLGSS